MNKTFIQKPKIFLFVEEIAEPSNYLQ